MKASAKQGLARALVRQLPLAAEAADLYAALSGDGTRQDTLLFEGRGGTALILTGAAARLECRGGTVTLEALSEGGQALIRGASGAFSGFVRAHTDHRLELMFERCTSDDLEQRLRAPSPFDLLRFLVEGFSIDTREEPFTLSALGVVAFDHVDLLETIPPAAEDPLGFPDLLFLVPETLVVIESGRARAISVAFGVEADKETALFRATERLASLAARCERAGHRPVPLASPAGSLACSADLDDAAFAAVVATLKQRIAAGDIFQIVPSRTFQVPCTDPFGAFLAQRRADPSPYHFFLACAGLVLFGASPETSVRIFRENGCAKVEVKPIAGTRARSASGDEDDRLEAEMRLDEKEMAEHMMLVDLARNDVARTSTPGTRRVEKLLTVERCARVMHLVSSVTGALREDLHAVDALKACLNVGTLSGAPKIRATQLLRETERTKRGPYGGAIGWISGAGEMDMAVIIRSAVVRDGQAFVRAGAGVVHDSDPAAEAEETRRKASALLSVLGSAGSDR